MGESFVDVSYRGLELGRRLKLRDVGAEAAYVEIPLPMPVGTRIEIATDDGVRIEATVAAVHEQVGGSDTHPGMRIRPVLSGAAGAWWKAHLDAAAVAAEQAAKAQAADEQARAEAEAAAAAPRPAAAPITDTPAAAMQRPTMVMNAATIEAALAAADELEGYKDDGKRTEMMSAVTPPVDDAVDTIDDMPVVPDVKATTVMDAIDISMITGEGTAEVGAQTEEDDEVEMTIEAEDEESSGVISTELPATPSGATEKSGANGKPRRGGRGASKKRGKKR